MGGAAHRARCVPPVRRGRGRGSRGWGWWARVPARRSRLGVPDFEPPLEAAELPPGHGNVGAADEFELGERRLLRAHRGPSAGLRSSPFMQRRYPRLLALRPSRHCTPRPMSRTPPPDTAPRGGPVSCGSRAVPATAGSARAPWRPRARRRVQGPVLPPRLVEDLRHGLAARERDDPRAVRTRHRDGRSPSWSRTAPQGASGGDGRGGETLFEGGEQRCDAGDRPCQTLRG